MKSKFDLIRFFGELGYTRGAEIGVSEGYFSEAMFESIPNLELYCIDAWRPYAGNRWGGSLERHANHYEKAKARLSKYNAHLISAMSHDAVRDFLPESLDFVYIDGNHAFDYVMQDLIEWSRKVKKGGIVSGDDYYHFKGAGVVEAVDAYTKAHGIKFNLTDPLTDKLQDRGCQEQPSFWWIK